MEYRVLGPVEVCDGARAVALGGHRQRLLLAVLISRANEACSTDWLVDAVWGDTPPRTARKTLQAYIARLRALLGDDAIEGTGDSYRVVVAEDDLDSARFARDAATGGALLPTDPRAAAAVLGRALEEWSGLPYGNLAEHAALQAEAQRLVQLRRAALTDRVEADLATGHGADLVPELTHLVADDPTDERLRGHLMLALYRADRQVDALAVFEDARCLLRDQLGLDPSDDLVDLHTRILRHDPGLIVDRTPDEQAWTSAPNPYKGLRPFGTDDASDFFGRDELVQRILAAIAARPMVAVVGPSGSGKSSAVAAGVIPQLRVDDRCVVAVMVPGPSPFHALVAALERARPDVDVSLALRGDDLDLVRAVPLLLRSDQHLVLVIDQFEELLAHSNADVRNRFLHNVAEAAQDPSCAATVVVTLRGDFLDRMVQAMPDGALLTDALVTASPLTAVDLAAAATRPAERVGVHLEPELVAELVGDMGDQPGGLPLFEYALTELFDARTGAILTRADYQRLGGLAGALARRAEQTYCALEPAQQHTCRQVFLRLVSVSETATTRRRTPLAELDAPGMDHDDVSTSVEAFDRARLLTFDRDPQSGAPTVEVAHEALLVEWPRLRGWLEDSQEELRLHRSLTDEVAEWERSGRQLDFLISGSRLALFDSWPSAATVAPTSAECAFLDASRARREATQAAQRRTTRRLQVLVALTAVIALVAGGLAWVAADRSAASARSERAAHARELANAALSVVGDDPELATLLALESVDVSRSDGSVLREAHTALHEAVMANRVTAAFPGQWQAQFTPDGNLLVGGRPARVVDASTGQDVLVLPEPPDGKHVESVAVSPDGTLAVGTDSAARASATNSSRLFLYDAAGAELQELRSARYGTAHGDTIGPLEFSPDGSLLASLAPYGGGLALWDTTSGDLLATHTEGVFATSLPITVDVAFSADGSTLALAREGTVRLLDLASDTWSSIDVGHDMLTSAVVFLDDGRIATAGWDGRIGVHDVASGQLLSSIDAEMGQVFTMRANPDGTRLVTGGDTGRVRLWRVEGTTVSPVADLVGQREAVTSVAIDGARERAAATGMGGRTVVWDISDAGPGEIAAWAAGGTAVFGPDGRTVGAVDTSGRHVEILLAADWTVSSRVPDVASTTGQITGLDISPDGATVATTTVEDPDGDWGELAVWDAASGRHEATIVKHPTLLGSVAFSSDGTRLAAAACSATLAGGVWNLDEKRFDLIIPEARCGQEIALSSDAALVAVDTEDEDEPNVQVWDVATAELVTAVRHTAMWRGGLDFSPDDTRLVSGGVDGAARVWDVATGDLVVALTGHTGPVEAVTYTPDGSRIITSSSDGTVRAWAADSGEMLLVLSGHDGFAHLSISPDGRHLLTSDGTMARVWTLDTDELTTLAEERLTRGLTAAECETYHVEDCP